MLYKLCYVGGDSTLYDTGVYTDEKTTDKVIRFDLLKDTGFMSGQLSEQNLTFKKSSGWTKEILTESFYPKRCGIPHWFEELTKDEVEAYNASVVYEMFINTLNEPYDTKTNSNVQSERAL
jgi:hypothetical protein